jgi:hypothetical protein
MKSRKELMTIKEMFFYLEKEIKNGNGDAYIFVNEFFIGSGEPNFDENLYTDAVHVMDVLDYCDSTGDVISC